MAKNYPKALDYAQHHMIHDWMAVYKKMDFLWDAAVHIYNTAKQKNADLALSAYHVDWAWDVLAAYVEYSPQFNDAEIVVKDHDIVIPHYFFDQGHPGTPESAAYRATMDLYAIMQQWVGVRWSMDSGYNFESMNIFIGRPDFEDLGTFDFEARRIGLVLVEAVVPPGDGLLYHNPIGQGNWAAGAHLTAVDLFRLLLNAHSGFVNTALSRLDDVSREVVMNTLKRRYNSTGNLGIYKYEL